MAFSRWFKEVTGHQPWHWQADLAADAQPVNRLIRIPTGYGKTLGVLAAWWWNRIENCDSRWPRRLVISLPMRTLVEQTLEVVGRFVDRAARGLGDRPGVTGLMGGLSADEWHLRPEHESIIVGTQDMLLSRALNRGYASGRARWPIDFAMLSHDVLWVVDEVQLMGVGLRTSAQLQAFRNEWSMTAFRPAITWWMSATLQPDWLRTPEHDAAVDGLVQTEARIDARDQSGPIWETRKSLRIERLPASDDRDAKGLAERVLALHRGHAAPAGRVTLVVLNQVETAMRVHGQLRAALRQASEIDLRLIHSRFRPRERSRWTAEFLSRDASQNPRADRIVVATQVVEAGVDVTASALFTELAPWSSLVQRFGRAARYGGSADIVVVDRSLAGAEALPYTEEELASAREALDGLDDVAIAALEHVDAKMTAEQRGRLYPQRPWHRLTRRELEELFDTTPDLTGADIDVSRFIREGEERDLLVGWIDSADAPKGDEQPTRDSLCPVPIGKAREWLYGKSTKIAFVHDYIEGEWRRVHRDELRPGLVLLVPSDEGGYDPQRGFDPSSNGSVPAADGTLARDSDEDCASRSDAVDPMSERSWQTITDHSEDVSTELSKLASAFGIPANLGSVLSLVARLHDWGKAHPAFQGSIVGERAAERNDWAKAPSQAWISRYEMYKTPATGHRKGFRHELASALLVIELLAASHADHPSILGELADFVDADLLTAPAAPSITHPLADELASLQRDEIDLALYLIVAHHGKVRGTLAASPADQDFDARNGPMGQGQPIRGVRDQDIVPACALRTSDGRIVEAPSLRVSLDVASLGLSNRYGRSWMERVAALRDRHGPFALAWLETIVRTADVRASRSAREDQTPVAPRTLT